MHSSDLDLDHPDRESWRRPRRFDSESHDNVAAVLCKWLRAITDLEEQLALPRVMTGEVPVILHVSSIRMNVFIVYTLFHVSHVRM